jgi:hypothetical protein
MKHLSCIVCLLAILGLAFSCQSDKRKQGHPDFEPKHISAKKFNEIFQTHAWYLKAVYNVYSSDSLQLIGDLEGGGLSLISYEDKVLYEYFWGVLDRHRRAGRYTYDETNNTLSMKFNDGKERLLILPDEYVVLSIDKDEIHCKGEVFVSKWAPTATFGYYVFAAASEDYIRDEKEGLEQSIKMREKKEQRKQ